MFKNRLIIGLLISKAEIVWSVPKMEGTFAVFVNLEV